MEPGRGIKLPNEGTHKHKCFDPECETVWEHGDYCTDYVKAHTCPKCGKLQRWKYFGPDKPSHLPTSTAC